MDKEVLFDYPVGLGDDSTVADSTNHGRMQNDDDSDKTCLQEWVWRREPSWNPDNVKNQSNKVYEREFIRVSSMSSLVFC